MMSDTIFAQASARGRAGVAVIRISGPMALPAATSLAGSLPSPRRASLRLLRDPATSDPLDEGLVIVFPGPGSFTGEDCVELQVHGSGAVLQRVMAALAARPGLRLAEAGEFTRRAFLSGRLDLAQVEALGDLLVAETAAQHRQAMAAMGGRLGAIAGGWRSRLVRVLALVEATIDFTDEDLPADVLEPALAILDEVIAEMDREVGGSAVAERLRDGFEVALVGRPNAGKSTLLNALAGRAAALTSPLAGTTRDVIEVRMGLDGLPLTILDMAGLRNDAESVETMGISLARERATAADLRIFLVDGVADASGIGVARRPDDLVLRAKGDLSPGPGAVSGLTGLGVEAMLAEIGRVLGGRVAGASSLAHARQREAVEGARGSAAAAAVALGASELRVEIVAEEVRSALRALDFLVGRVDVEAVLDVIFSSFCLGK